MTESSFRRLLLRFALFPLVALGAFLVLLILQIHEITVRRAEATRATAVLLQDNLVLQSVIDEETGIRGFLISKDPLFLEPYRRASARVGGELSAFSTLTSASPALSEKVAAIASNFKDFDAVNQALLKGDLTNSAEVDLLKRQKDLMDTLRGELADVGSIQNEVRGTLTREINSIYDKLPVFAVICGTLVAILLIWHGVFLFLKITRVFRQQLNETQIQRDSLDTTLQSIGDAVIVCDSSGNVTLMNPTAEEVTGWKKEDAIGQSLDSVFRIINEYSRRPVESPVDKVLQHGQVVGLANHTLLIRADGSEISIDDSGAPVRDRKGAIVGVVLVFRDIEARRKSERELALRTAELESMLFHSPVGFASLDRTYRYIRVNRALAHINGIAAEEHIGKRVSDIFPANASTLESLIDDIFTRRTPVQQEIVGETARDPGVQRQWLTCFYPVLTEHRDDPVLAGVIMLETTDRWRAQESLMRSEKLAAVGRLAASIAHEMNNPLASLTNLLYLIAQDETIEGETREFVDRANIELARASKIATQTLRFAKRSMSPALVDLDEAVGGVLLLFSGRITLHQVTIVKKIRRTVRYFGHASEVMQVLTNLVGNSLDAIHSRGRMVVSIQGSKNWKTGVEGIAITVADSGKGIPKHFQSKIWEPFFTTKADTGTGLGLWLVDEMVKKNGGTVQFRSSTEGPRAGTTFRIFLPNREEPSRA